MEDRATTYELLNHPFITREEATIEIIRDPKIDIYLDNELDYSKYMDHDKKWFYFNLLQ